MFTDKAKEKFEAWYVNEFKKKWNEIGGYILQEFYELPLSMQWGVILEFADSLGYYINSYIWNHPLEGNKIVFSVEVENAQNEILIQTKDFLTRKEAQQEAIKKLNQLINKD